jgi:translation elongation factor EF-Ts
MSDLNSTLKRIYEDIQQKEADIAQTLEDIQNLKQQLSKNKTREKEVENVIAERVHEEFNQRAMTDPYFIANPSKTRDTIERLEKNVLNFIKKEATK